MGQGARVKVAGWGLFGVVLSLAAVACDGGGGTTNGGGAGGGNGAGGTGAERVVWLGAHPDDELYAAPWLAHVCLDRGARCTLVVMTRGEAGNCKLPGGCTPDLATVREAELAASAALFGAELVHWNLGDGTDPSPEGVVTNWAATEGSLDGLVDRIVAELAGADRVVTFDPRHGDSCHADHRATGALAIAAAEAAGIEAASTQLVASQGILTPAAPADPAVWGYDASVVLAATAQPAWATLVDVLETHASQFTADEVAEVAAVPAAAQRTWLIDLADAVEDDPLYDGVCP